MVDPNRDPIINVIHNGIKRGIRVALENNCLPAALILIYSGIDTMAYLNMPADQDDVHRASSRPGSCLAPGEPRCSDSFIEVRQEFYPHIVQGRQVRLAASDPTRYERWIWPR